MNPNAQRGLGLVEVAVTVLLVSITVLGLARARLVTQETGHAARQWLRASDLAEGLLEAMRANPQALPQYRLQSASPFSPPPVDCAAAACGSDAWGQWNLWQWHQQLTGAWVRDSRALPVAALAGASACVTVAGEQVQVQLRWDRRPGAADTTDCQAGTGSAELALRSRVGEG